MKAYVCMYVVVLTVHDNTIWRKNLVTYGKEYTNCHSDSKQFVNLNSAAEL
jgi:hypothetical protein